MSVWVCALWRVAISKKHITVDFLKKKRKRNDSIGRKWLEFSRSGVEMKSSYWFLSYLVFSELWRFLTKYSVFMLVKYYDKLNWKYKLLSIKLSISTDTLRATPMIRRIIYDRFSTIRFRFLYMLIPVIFKFAIFKNVRMGTRTNVSPNRACVM